MLLRTGPLVLFISGLTLLVGERRRRRRATFVGTALLTFVVAWFAAGQTVGNLSSYIGNGSLGYSQAMGAGRYPGSRSSASCCSLVRWLPPPLSAPAPDGSAG